MKEKERKPTKKRRIDEKNSVIESFDVALFMKQKQKKKQKKERGKSKEPKESKKER